MEFFGEHLPCDSVDPKIPIVGPKQGFNSLVEHFLHQGIIFLEGLVQFE
jgi:hypothetical protein